MYYPVGSNRSLMIVLLVAYIIRVGRCSPDESLLPADDGTTTVTDPTTAADKSTTATTDPATPALATDNTDQSSPVDDSKATTFSKCKEELYKSLSTIRMSAGMLLKGVGQAALTVMGALFGAFGSLISMTAATGETAATGVNLVNNVTGKLPLVRDVTGGAAKLATNLASTYRKNVEYTNENREKLYDSLDKALENYHPEIVANSKPTDTTAAAAATPTNEGGQATDTTATEAAPATTPSV